MKKQLIVPIGHTEEGPQQFLDLTQAGNTLVVGATGSGKSVFLHNAISHLTSRYDEQHVNLVLIDNKYVEFGRYKNLPHAKPFVAMTAEESLSILNWVVDQIRSRQQVLVQNDFCNILQYNELTPCNKLAHIVVIVDEATHLLFDDECNQLLTTILEYGPSVGISTIVSLQTLWEEALTTEFRNSFQHTICFRVSGEADSMALFNRVGAEGLAQGECWYQNASCQSINKVKVPFVK